MLPIVLAKKGVMGRLMGGVLHRVNRGANLHFYIKLGSAQPRPAV